MALEQIGVNHSFGGRQERYRHDSKVLNCPMTFSIYLPPQANIKGHRLPVLYWLSGLTCSDENFVQKAGCAAICRRTRHGDCLRRYQSARR